MEELNKTNQESQDEQELTEKPLSIGNTKIGTKRGMYNGKYRELSIYYGNYVKPMIDGQFLTMDESAYRQILEDFLNSDEGRQYRIPTEEEYEKAIEVVKDKIAQRMATQPKPATPAEPIKEEDIKPVKDKDAKPEAPKKKGFGSLFGGGNSEKAKEPEKAEPEEVKVEESKEEKTESPQEPPAPVISKETLELQEKLNALEEENRKNLRALEKANEQKQHYKNKLAIANAPKKQKTNDFLFRAVSIMLIAISVMSIIVFFLSTYR